MYALPDRNKKTLIKKIRQYKKACFPGKGSGARLAEEIGVPKQTVSNWLSGRRTPTFEQLYRLSVAFNVSPLELCGIHEKAGASKSHAAFSLLRELLNVVEKDIEHNVDPRVTMKTMDSINRLILKAMEEMAGDGGNGKM